ncbi:MAG: methionyl-tRNA formyltransferase [Verrucomicrobiota bacterium]|nr:methionyl-tRNA formyltransferase [Verrucomicrobiota bacterium]
MGTAPLACASLAALVRAPEFQIVGIVTQPDKPKGRDLKLQFSAVKEVALKNHLAILQPESARDEEFIQTLRNLNPDLIVVVAYGQILSQTILDLPHWGCLNVHTSLLPKYRGAAPIQWALLHNESETGVTIIKMDAGLDTGDILAQQVTPISPADNSQTLHDRLAQLGAELLPKTIEDFIRGKILPRKQPAEGSSYARKISKEDGRLVWSEPASKLWNQIRAFTPWPGAFTFQLAQPKPRLLKIWAAEVVEKFSGEPGVILEAEKNGIMVACGEKALRILTLQPDSGKRLSAQEFLSGHNLRVGQKLISIV